MKELERTEPQTNAVILESKDGIHGNRYVTLLTENHGVINAYANGAKNPKNKLSGVTQPLVYGKYVLVQKGNAYTIQSGHILHQFAALHEDMDAFFLALYFAQLLSFLSPKADRSKECLRLFLNTLYYLENKTLVTPQLKALFELRLLSICGYMPDLVACRECGKYEDVLMMFDPREGNLLCSSCKKNGQSLQIHPSVLRAMRHIIYSSQEDLFRFTLTKQEHLEELEKTSEIYVLEQMGTRFKALEFYRKMMSI